MKKTIFMLYLALFTVENSYANSNANSNAKTCKHNVMHFATSVERVNYVKNLLDLKSFNLKDLNKQCQSAPHIAVELGNLEILELFYDYLGHLNIENSNGENLFQSAFLYKQPSVMLFLISKGENPRNIASNGLDAYDYQNKYGNNLTAKILEEYNVKENELNIVNKYKKKDQLLKDLYIQIEEKEKTLSLLMAKSKTDESINQIKELINEISKMKLYIQQLESIIRDQALLIEKYKSNNENKNNALIELSIESTPESTGTLVTHVPENSTTIKKTEPLLTNSNKMKDIDLSETIIKKDLELSDLSNDGEVLNDSMKLFELFSKPIFKIKKK